MALKLAEMDLSDDAMLDALKSVGLRYNSECVLLTVESAQITCAALWGQPFKYEELENQNSPRLFRTIRRGVPLVINDVTQNPTTLQGVTLDSTVRGYASAPVCISDQYVGSVVMTFSKPQQFMLNQLRDFHKAARNIGELLKVLLQSAAQQQSPHAQNSAD